MSEVLNIELVFVTILGAVLGSFSNVIIYRFPIGKSIVSPRSACPSCGSMIPWYHNIPILSWFILRGRCAHCKASVSFRYPLVETIMATLFGLIFNKYGHSGLTFEYSLAAFGLVTASFIDIDHFLLPDVFTLTGIGLGILGSIFNPDRTLFDSISGILMGGGFLWLVAYGYWLLRHEEGMGGGDIKLLAWLGALLGWKAIPFIVLVSSVTGSIVGILLLVLNKGNLKTAIPFGPYLVVAALIYILGNQDLGRLYLQVLFPSQV